MNFKQTINKFLILGVLSAGTMPVYEASAQSVKAECLLVSEQIVNLETPVFGGALKWKRSIAQAEDQLGIDRLVRMFDSQDGFLVIGEHKNPSTKATYLRILKMDYNGKLLGSVQKDLKTKGQILEVLHHNKKIIILMERLGDDGLHHAEIRVYSEKGDVLQNKVYKDDSHIVIPSALVMGTDGELYLATQHKRKNQTFAGMSSVIYKLKSNLGIAWKRSYLPSSPSRIHKIIPRKNGGFLVAGEIAVTGGKNRKRVGGWLMALSPQGGMEWQRAYPRGYNARLNYVHETEQGHIFTAGTAYPVDKGSPASWVMTNYANSNPIWQRYFRGPYNYKTVGFEVSDNNQAMVLLQGTPTQKQGGVDHVRVLDLSDLGHIMADHSYIEGNGVEGHTLSFFEDKNIGRYVLGSAKMPATKDVHRILDGWIASLYPLRKRDECQ